MELVAEEIEQAPLSVFEGGESRAHREETAGHRELASDRRLEVGRSTSQAAAGMVGSRSWG